MTVYISPTATGVDLTLRIPGLHPVTFRAPTVEVAVSCARSVVADERRKVLAMLDGMDAELAALNARAVADPPVA